MNIKEMFKNTKIKISDRGLAFPSLFEIVFLIFLICKITGVINWSWWIVFLPLLIEFGIVILAIVLLFIIFYIIIKIDERNHEDI